MHAIVDLRGSGRAVRELAGIANRNWRLLVVMVRREVLEAHSGQVLGGLWAVVHPLFLMGVYAFVFNLIFRARIGGTYDLPLDYTVYILSGLIPWMTFQQALNKGSLAVTSSGSLVKQVVFPVELLPMRSAISSLLVMAIGAGFLILYVALKEHRVLWTYLLLPGLVAVTAIAMIGMAFIVSALTVFVRDVRDFIQLFCVINVYMIPAVFLPGATPAPLKPIFYLNPFSYMVWCYQDVLYYGRLEHAWAWVVFVAFSVAVLAFGYRLFRRLKPYFGNVL